MSLFKTASLACPQCTKSLEFEVVHSVNADRRADLRAAILGGTFQREECPHCQVAFRLDPEFTYTNLRRKQWIAVHPLSALERWPDLEAHARESFARSYGDKAPPVAQELGAGVRPRLVFGWSALREKLVVNELGLDDVELELLKIGLIRNLPESSFSTHTELRLLEERPAEPGAESDGPVLHLAWLRGTTADFVEGVHVAREVYDEVRANEAGWKALRTQLAGGLFVDMQRLVAVTRTAP